jgi:membrane protease subunit HflC
LKRAAIAAAALLLLLVLGGAVFVVREDQQVILTQFGQPVRGPITEPGLAFKLPLIQKMHVFDKRFLEWQGDAEELTTKDKKYIFVHAYARWRISDPLLFFQRLTNEPNAQSRLDDILDGETRNAIARHNLLEVVRSSNRTPGVDESKMEEEQFAPIEAGRDKIRREILDAAKASAGGLGVEILDVQFRRINYSDPATQNAVFQRMISERKRIADRFRSARAYGSSADARAFYEFVKTMETFEATFDPDTTLLLSTGGDLFQFLERSSP